MSKKFHVTLCVTKRMVAVQIAAPRPAPTLPEPGRRQLFVWGCCAGAAILLLASLAFRLWRHVDPVWWLPPALLAGMLAADFLSGVVHWAADTWGRADFPVLGPRLLVPFRIHHLNPDDFLRRRFLDANGDVAALTIPLLAALVTMPLESAGQQALAVAGFAFCAAGGLTNQIHQWAHMTSPPRAVRWLQRARLLLRQEEHDAHHRGPYDGHYCITTGWCNRPLEALGFFRRLETVITRTTGLRPRDDEQAARHA